MEFFGVPERIVAGDTIVFYVDDDDRRPSDGWTYSIAFVAPGSLKKGDATADGTRHKFEIAAPDVDGTFSWQLYATQAGKRTTVAKGSTIVEPDFAKAGGGRDGRSTAERTLAAIEATIERRASKDQMAYTVDNRQLQRTPIPDLLVLRDRYKAIVKRERQAARMAQGLPTSSSIRVRFNG